MWGGGEAPAILIALVHLISDPRWATENAGVENAGVVSRGGKYRSSLAVDGQLNLECKERQRQVTSWKKMF